MKVCPLLLLSSLCSLCRVAASPIGDIVNTRYGSIRGNAPDAKGIRSFKGIPFAEPPVGNLRWQSPRSPQLWNTTLDTTKFGQSCWSFLTLVPPPTVESEDCLTVNVWSPATDTQDNLPVMVWIYGGGFQFGSTAEARYDGSGLASKDVVLVSLNYRMGLFGFLALSELDKEGSSSGNYGLQDQLFGLQWVKENIALFGGDPSKVTIFGESAGAHAVGLLVSSPESKGLISGAILESGAFWDSVSGSLRTPAEARAFGQDFLQRMAVSSVAQLRVMSAQTLVTAGQWTPTTDPVISAFSPSIDGFVLPTTPAEAFATGHQALVSLLAGWNGAEYNAFVPFELPHLTAQLFEQAAMVPFGSDLGQFKELYPDATIEQLNSSAETLCSDTVIRQQTWDAVDKQSRHVPSTYAYFYTYASPYSPVPGHTAEIPFVFGTLNSTTVAGGSGVPTAADEKISDTIMTYWTNFAKTGDPNGPGLATWPKYTSEAHEVIMLANVVSAGVYSLDRFQFIEKYRLSNGSFPHRWRNVQIQGSLPSD
ncbi:hypothetical protein FA10DRAFT_297766 [Acaromyces ingoldii]|uniref:Carboxylic ester hydrolase n=1 Tax=Acaromyces ingoldii TaxID=215250 RepID=A0A316YD39_9BASI|nr:hypothetical protein FA10DRAFT_297766 [Acaromyces ingoldii]PWN86764.1 hypothetical protein FA10DRAFT_297766 [Acaromyces ingoldii]